MMNRKLTEQDWLDFYEAQDMRQVENCRKWDLLNYYGPSPDRQGYIFEEWRHYAESKMWLDKAVEILTEKNKKGNFKTIYKEELAFVLDYKHEDVEIPQAVIIFITDRLRGVDRQKGSGTPKSIVEKWGKRKKQFEIGIEGYGHIYSKETIGKLFGAKQNPDLVYSYPDTVAYLSEKYKVGEGYVKEALKKYNPKKR